MKYRFNGISEFISRRARIKLVRLLLDNGMTQAQLAEEVGVTQQAVSKWLDPKETHPRNENLNRLLVLGWAADSNSTLQILRDELTIFRRLLSKGFRARKSIKPQNAR